MNPRADIHGIEVTLNGASLIARRSGALFWPEQNLLCVSDLHLGKSERTLRRGGPALPPYETRDTLTRLAAEIDATGAKTILCLGDSFDDLAAAQALHDDDRLWITRLQAGRHWIWIEGNHDPGPIEYGGTHLAEMSLGPLSFRHIATPQVGEVSGHYHPKVSVPTRGRVISRPAFLLDMQRIIMPAFGTYTGGLRADTHTLSRLMAPGAHAVLTGAVATRVPLPR